MISIERDAIPFIRESNKIEGILRDPNVEEVSEFLRFMNLHDITLKDLKHFVAIYQSDAELRDRPGLNVFVGDYVPPPGDITIRTRLEDILADANGGCYGAFEIHKRYESLHPFTDGNGRSGRMLWKWMVRKSPLGFLHTWYYQSLETGR